MSIVTPWDYGINRADIQQLVREIVILATGLAPEKVFLTDVAADLPQPSRSWAAIQLGDPVLVQPTWTEERDWLSEEQWLVTIDSVAGDPQRLTIAGTNYDYTAASGDVEATRDGLLVAIGSPSNFTAVGIGTDQIQLDSTIAGLRLDVMQGAGNDFTIAKLQSNVTRRLYRRYQLQCNIICNGAMDIESPDTTTSGQSLADLVDLHMSSRDVTEKMRDCGHVPVRISRVLDAGPLDRQQLNQATVQVIIATTGRLDIDLATTTAIPIQSNAVQ